MSLYDDYLLHDIAKDVRAIRSKLNVLLNEEYEMADALQAAFDGLTQKIDAAEALDTSVVSVLKDLKARVEAIQPGTTVTADQVQALADGLGNATTTLNSAVADAQAQPTPVGPPAATATQVQADPAAVDAQPAQAQPTADVVSGTPDQTGTTAAPAADVPAAAPADPGQNAAATVAAASGTAVDPATAQTVPADQVGEVSSIPTPEQAQEAAAQPAGPAQPAEGAPAGSSAATPDTVTAA